MGLWVLTEAEGGVFGSSSADHVTSATSHALMWFVFVSLETIRQRCKQGDPLPPTDSLFFTLFPSSHQICKDMQAYTICKPKHTGLDKMSCIGPSMVVSTEIHVVVAQSKASF